jgi:uncharacterized protein (DUF924 family)
MPDLAPPEEVLRFWFDAPKSWFAKEESFDAAIRERFLPLYEQAAAGLLAHWKDAPGSCLALILVLDQFPRNMFRGTARAFAADALALDAARHAVASGHDRAMLPAQRVFVYLPFEHSESLDDQTRGCELTQPLAAFPDSADAHHYALAHRDIVRRFGRFPHRNAILGRANRPEEIEFLKGPGSRF